MRIRSLKPEFFDSPSTAEAGPWARLLYMGMWCMADDWGVGPGNPKELAASIFPNDDQWTAQELPSLCKEVADSYGVEFYTHRGRRYFQIPSWEEHQVTQRRAKRRYPTSDDPESSPDQASSDLPRVRKELPCEDKEKSSSEQGNRGTGEQGNRGTSSAIADAAPTEPEAIREDVRQVCEALADHVEAIKGKRPNITKTWERDARLLLDTDEHTLPEALAAIEWATKHAFWGPNILSVGKLREKWWTMRAQASQPAPGQKPAVGIASQMEALRFYEGK